MSAAPEEFDKLQKLLKLKRHEQPPPGYFNNFSTNVVNRLERESERGVVDQVRWLNKFLAMLETNPFAAGIFGMSICGLLISGIAWSQYRPPSTYSGASNVTVDVADSGVTPSVPEWNKTASPDSLTPSTAAVFGTNTAGALFEGSLPVQRINLQLDQ